MQERRKSSPLYYELREAGAHVRFAERTEWTSQGTAWSRALETRQRSGLPILDLTASNPTHCGFTYDAKLLTDLSAVVMSS